MQVVDEARRRDLAKISGRFVGKINEWFWDFFGEMF